MFISRVLDQPRHIHQHSGSSNQQPMQLQRSLRHAGVASTSCRPVILRVTPRTKLAALRAQAAGHTPRPRAPPSPLLLRGQLSHHSRSGVTRAAASSDRVSWNPVEVVKREAGLQSNRLPDDVRERVESAVEVLRFRVTVGDVAARAGVKLSEADDALKALAYDALAALEVSKEGDVVYVFPQDFRARLRNRSVLLRTKPFVQKLQQVSAYLLRVAFGTALVSSIAIVWLAIIAITSSNRDDRDRNSGRSNFSGNSPGFGGRVYFDLTDLLWYLDPYYYRTTQERLASGASLSFVEAIFSFVFGDGDPNTKFEEMRWQQLGKLIQSKGGVVTAEEMAPFLDPPPLEAQGRGGPSGAYADESFVLPALIKFGGEPSVDSEGHLLYKFPSLQRTGVARDVIRPPSFDVPLEEPWQFSAASGGQTAVTVGLGLLNFVGVAVLGGLLADPHARYVLMAQGLGWIAQTMPALQLYALSFFAIPAVRWFWNNQRNVSITDRNDARVEAAQLLNSGVDRTLASKLQSARREGEQKTLRKSDMIFSSEKDMAVSEIDEWDRRMQEKGTKGRRR